MVKNKRARHTGDGNAVGWVVGSSADVITHCYECTIEYEPRIGVPGQPAREGSNFELARFSGYGRSCTEACTHGAEALPKLGGD